MSHNMIKISRIELITLIFVFLMILTGMVLFAIDRSLFNDYVHEDGIIEWLTVAALVCGMIICLTRTIRLRNKKTLFFLSGTVFFTLVFIFGAGEEVSWGQRMFNLDTPDIFKKYNAQKETNIHNFIVYGVKINKLVFSKILGIVAVIYTLLLPYLYRKKKGMKKFIDSLAIPIPMVHHAVSIRLVLILINLIPDSKIGELLEFGGSYIFVLIVLYPYNKEIFQGT